MNSTIPGRLIPASREAWNPATNERFIKKPAVGTRVVCTRDKDYVWVLGTIVGVTTSGQRYHVTTDDGLNLTFNGRNSLEWGAQSLPSSPQEWYCFLWDKGAEAYLEWNRKNRSDNEAKDLMRRRFFQHKNRLDFLQGMFGKHLTLEEWGLIDMSLESVVERMEEICHKYTEA